MLATSSYTYSGPQECLTNHVENSDRQLLFLRNLVVNKEVADMK